MEDQNKKLISQKISQLRKNAFPKRNTPELKNALQIKPVQYHGSRHRG